MTIERLLLFLGLYLFSAIPFGVIVSRLITKKDVRSQGSGNIGATNVSRMMGKKWGLLVLFLDALKGFIATAVAGRFGYAELGVLVSVFGHCFPVYLKFKGGKGVATSVGALLGLNLALALAAIGAFIFLFVISRRVSFGSLGAAFFVVVIGLVRPAMINPIMALALCALVWWRHKENIHRIIKGSEPKFF